MENIRGHHLFTHPLSNKATVIDLGAFKGEFAKKISQLFHCKVFAIEANPVVFPETYHDENVIKFNNAITDKNGAIRFYLANNPEGNSIFEAHSAVNDTFVEVEGITLSSFLAERGIDYVDILKVDIEGAEIHLFNNLDDAVLNKIGQITIEFHDFIPELNIAQEVLNIKKRLKQLGFKEIVCELPNKDVLFVKLERIGISAFQFHYEKITMFISLVWKKAINDFKNIVKMLIGYKK
jgi:FkbM family methyltransferase